MPTPTGFAFDKKQASDDKLKRNGGRVAFNSKGFDYGHFNNGGAKGYNEGIFDQGFGEFSPVKKQDNKLE